MHGRRRSPLIAAALLMAQLGLVLGIGKALNEPQPHGVPVALVAPTAVGEAIAAEVAQIDEKPFDVVVSPGLASARTDLVEGRVQSVLQLDLATTRDRLLLLDTMDPRLRGAVIQRLHALDEARGRSATTRTIATEATPLHRVRLLTLLAVPVGFVIVVGVTLRRGAVSRNLAFGTLRLAGFAAASLTGGFLLSIVTLGRLDLTVAAVSGLVMLTTATVTQALAVLCGFPGLGVAGAMLVGAVLPLLTSTDPMLLPVAWQRALAWSPVGAATAALRSVTQYDASGWMLPVGVLVAWLAAGLAMLVWSRVEIDAVAPEATTVPDSVAPNSRWRVALAVVPVLALTVTLLPLIGHRVVPASARPVPRAATSKCAATGKMESIADLNRISAKLRGSPGFQGGDVGAGATLQDGRRLFLFGDTLRAPGFSGQRFVRNSMLIADPNCLAVVLPASRGAVIPDRQRGGERSSVGYWPMSVGAQKRPGYDLVAVMAQRVLTTGTGSFDFANVGPSVAVFVVPRGQTPQLIATKDFGPDSSDISRPMWGAASAVHDGWLYLYGTSRSASSPSFGFGLSVARVRPDHVMKQKEWRYWDGSHWSKDASAATALINGRGGTSQTLSVFSQGGRWFALSKRDEFLGRDLTVWTAPNAWGPFDQGHKVADLPTDTARGELRYMPLAHPDLLPKPGTVVVSYSRNNSETDKVVDNPFLYRPRFLRVRLP